MLRLLLNFWLYPMFGMMFAAGAGVLDGGAGGGDGAGNAGGTDGDLSGTGDGDDGASAGDGSEGGDGTQTDDVSDVADGRDQAGSDDQSATSRLDPKWKKVFEAAKAQGVEKEVKQLYFAQQRLNKAIPGGVNAAIALAKSVEEFGGVEGVQQLQDDLASHSEDAELFSRADPRWVESGFQENPEAALKLFTHTLDYVADKHPEHYNHLGAKIIVNDLDQGLPVRDIHRFLAGIKDSPEATQLAKKLADYYNSRADLAKKVPEKKVDAVSKSLTERESKVTEREMNVRYTQVNTEIFPAMKNSVTKTLQGEAKLKGVDLNKLSAEYPGEWRSMLNEIHQQIMGAVRKDERFVNKYAALVSKGDLKRAAAAVNAKHDAVIPDIARKVMQSYGVFRGKKANAGDKGDKGDKGNAGAAGNAGNANAGWAQVSAKPPNSTIDYSKTTQAMQLDGKYILNDGKKVIVKY